MSLTQTYPPPLPQDVALFLDFDGTLAPLQDDPDAVFLPMGGDAVLMSLAQRFGGALAVISGRDLFDLSKRVPQALWRFGNHGLRSAAPGETVDRTTEQAPIALLAGIESIAQPHKGVRVEVKGPIIAVHYRAAPAAGPELLAALNAWIAAQDGYSLQHGKFVIEAKPSGANKGKCLEAVMRTAPFKGRVPVMIGDDRTDEDAYDVVARLGGWSVKVGAGDSKAEYRLSDQTDVIAYLKEVLGKL